MEWFLRLVGLSPPPAVPNIFLEDEFICMLVRIDGTKAGRHRHDDDNLWSPRELRDWFQLRHGQYRTRIEAEGRRYLWTGRISSFFSFNYRAVVYRLDECHQGMHRMARRVEAVALFSIVHYRRGNHVVQRCLPRDVMKIIVQMVVCRPATLWKRRVLVRPVTNQGDLTGDLGFCERDANCVRPHDPPIFYECYRLDNNEDEDV
jgi:hypothetical protein